MSETSPRLTRGAWLDLGRAAGRYVLLDGAERASTPTWLDEVAPSLFAKHGGNVRAALRELYDRSWG